VQRERGDGSPWFPFCKETGFPRIELSRTQEGTEERFFDTRGKSYPGQRRWKFSMGAMSLAIITGVCAAELFNTHDMFWVV
jgi:hypothetical protein